MGDVNESEDAKRDFLRERGETEYTKEDVIQPEEHRETYPFSSRHSLVRQARSVEDSIDGRNHRQIESINHSRRQTYSPIVDIDPRHYRENQPDKVAANRISSMLKLNFGTFESTGSVVPPPKPFSVNANYYRDPHYSIQSADSFDRNGSHQFQVQPIARRYGAPWSRPLPGMQMPNMCVPIARYISPHPAMGRPLRHASLRPMIPYQTTVVHHMSPRYF